MGAYTSGAIAAIAYDERQAAMDANAERVIARLFAVEDAAAQGQDRTARACQALVPERAGDFAQALMDLGSAICTPKRPACAQLSAGRTIAWRASAASRNSLPVKAPKMARPLKRGAAFVARDKTGAVLLVKRPDKGLLASMLEPPLGPWTRKFSVTRAGAETGAVRGGWKKRPGIVRHGFTHFELEIEVYVADVSKRPKTKGDWIAAEQLGDGRAAHGDAQDRRTWARRRRSAVCARPKLQTSSARNR